MTAEAWVHSVLATKLEIGSEGVEVIRLLPDQTVPVTTFCTFFRVAIEDNARPDKYKALSTPTPHTFMWGEPPQQYTRTAAELGYQPVFDTWHAEGLI